ncbi:MAG: sigma-70 family RNA polymerase sigma factor [Neisseria sp.]|nr:sigma-70 family RNA polymerase sigma factor [Neisseria sp.]
MPNFQQKLAALRTDVLRFAKIQLRDDDFAEDLVQETLSTAMAKSTQFRGESSLKTWVLGILKHQISDYFRQQNKSVSLESLQAENCESAILFEECFDETGHWHAHTSPQTWQTPPEEALSRQDFFRAVENCLQGLPSETAKIFYQREILGWEVDEICQQHQISRDNCYTILHRARNQLRLCLQQRWFDLNP